MESDLGVKKLGNESTMGVVVGEIEVVGDGEADVGIGYYSWKNRGVLDLSKRERMIADAYLKNGDWGEAARVSGMSIGGCRELVNRKEHVVRYIGEKMGERARADGWTKERWLSVMTDHLSGEKRLRAGDMYGMKLIGVAIGIGEESIGSIFTSIQFVQSNGKE